MKTKSYIAYLLWNCFYIIFKYTRLEYTFYDFIFSLLVHLETIGLEYQKMSVDKHNYNYINNIKNNILIHTGTVISCDDLFK